MKLQIALDCNLKKALKICDEIKEFIDIIEIGTPLLKEEGLKSLKKFKKFRKILMADLKTMDVGFLEAELAFKYGADIISVCGAADKITIKEAVRAGKKFRKKVLVDLIGIKNPESRLKEISEIPFDYIGVHTGIDSQKKGENPLKNLRKISRIKKKKGIGVAGGINLENIKKIVRENPEIIIVGSAITQSKKPKKDAKLIKEEIK
jgi:3-hexulose-6-phosphate synthase